MFNKKTGNPQLFYHQNWFVNLSEYIWIFSDFFLISEIIFLVLKKRSSHETRICFRKKTTHYNQEVSR